MIILYILFALVTLVLVVTKYLQKANTRGKNCSVQHSGSQAIRNGRPGEAWEAAGHTGHTVSGHQEEPDGAAPIQGRVFPPPYTFLEMPS